MLIPFLLHVSLIILIVETIKMEREKEERVDGSGLINFVARFESNSRDKDIKWFDDLPVCDHDRSRLDTVSKGHSIR